MFSWLKKTFRSKEPLPKLEDYERTCPDCATGRGQLHDLFCLKERCPFCDGQLATCGCIHKVLNLGQEESKAVDEYIDDSVEPLKGIMERWKRALDDKGRMPYESVSLNVSPESLILASARGNLPFVKKLIEEGVPVDATNEVNYTPLMAAARSARLEVLSYLLESGADVHRRDIHGHTPLHCAVSSPFFETRFAPSLQSECVRVLLEHGAVPNTTKESGGTPLMSAAWFGCAPSIPLLLKAGADSSLRDNRGRTASDLASERGHADIAALLSQKAG